jgi:DNA-binding XRE family transcriptional regulator
MSKVAEQMLVGSPAKAAAAAMQISGEAVDEIEAALPEAITGNRRQLTVYVSAVNLMTERLLAAAREARPEIASKSPLWAKAMLQGGAINAPFSTWVGVMGPGKGVALEIVSRLRQTLPDTEPLEPPPRRRLPDWNLDDRDAVRFYRAVSYLLDKAEAPLERIGRAFDLNRTELAALFGVSRQAVERWEAQGVPSERQEKLSTIGAITDLLEAQLKPDRIAGVARRPAPAYGDRSILEAIAAGEEELVLTELRDAFDWARTT